MMDTRREQKFERELELKKLTAREKNLKESLRLAEKEIALLKSLVDKKYTTQTQLIRAQKNYQDKKTVWVKNKMRETTLPYHSLCH